MSTVREQLDRDRYKLIADKIMQLLDKIHDTSLSEKRWVWELLQNAKDVPNKFGRVSIKIELFPDKLEFCHNGNHFSVNNLSGLIQQVSSKDSQNKGEQTGKFGTGFITTHLLSRIINVSGVVQNPNTDEYQHFNIKLDRSARNSEELVPVIANSIRYVEGLDKNDFENFPIAENYENRSEDDFFTNFTYSLTPDTLTAAQIGLADLVNTLPLTMISLPKLKSVRVIDHIKNTDETYKCDSKILCESNSCQVSDSIITIEGSSNISKYFFTYKNDIVALSMEYVKDDEEKTVLLEHRAGQPNLLRDFPLIGSDKFHFPYILNGFRFEPTEMRDGLLLNKNEEKAQLNRSIIDKAVESALLFNNWLLSQNVGNTYLLAASREPVPVNIWDEEYAKPWIDNLQREWRSQLLNQNLVETDNGFTLLSNLRIPDFEDKSYKHDERFYDFVMDMMKVGHLPLKHQLRKWQNIIYPEYKSWNTGLKYTKTKFLEELESCKSLNNLSVRLGKDLLSTAQWMKDLVDFLIEAEAEKAFTEYSILPDAKGNFHKLIELQLDAKEPIPASIKEIYDALLGKDIESTLLHKSLSECAINGIALFGFKDAIKSINECIENKLSNYTSYQTDKSLWEKDKDAIFRIVNTIDPSAEIDNMGNRMRELIKPLLPEDSLADIIEGLDSSFWKTANRFILSMLPIVIDWNYSSIDSLRDSFFTHKKEVSDTIEWMNSLFSLINDANLSIAKDRVIFPDENGDFHCLENLHFDKAIPEAYKALDKLASNRDWNNELLHAELVGYDNHQPYDIASVYESVKKSFESATSDKKEEIAIHAISLIPAPSSAKHNAVDEIYRLSKIIFGERLPTRVEITQTNGFEWEKFAAFILDVLAGKVAKSIDISSFGKIYELQEAEVLSFVDCIIDYAETYYDKRHRSIVEEKHGVWVNQHGDFYPFKEIHVDSNIPDALKDMALNKRVNHDFREQLADNRFKFVKYLPQETAISVKEILGRIDDAIRQYVEDENGSLQQPEFTQLVLDLHAWNDAHNEDKQYTSFFNANHDRLMVGSLTEKETISLIGKLVGSKDKLAAAAELVSKYSAEEIRSLQNENEALKARVAYMEKYDGGNSELSNEQKQAYLEEARDIILEDLKNEGYDITNYDWNWTRILGVKDSDGKECPIIFRSNRSHRDTVITPTDWDILKQPNAMFGIVTSEGKVRKYKLNDLLKGSEFMTIRFATSNCDIPERLDKLSGIFRYFGGIQFNFEKYIEPTLLRWQSFMTPEKNTGEIAAAGSVDLMPE